MEDDDRFLVDTRSGAELGAEKKEHLHARLCHNKYMDHSEQVCLCVDKLTVIVCSDVQDAGMVVGRASTRRWGNSYHIREILSQFGE